MKVRFLIIKKRFYFFISASKIITIKSYPIALTCRFIQLLILSYVFGYIMWYKRGYQDHDLSIISSATLKVTGIGTYGENPRITLKDTDFIIPSQENNALFIMTSFISTDQKQTRCGESIAVKEAICKNHSECQAKLEHLSTSNGHWTGQCRMPEGRCEIEGWCPVEDDLILPPPIIDSLNYTVLVNNFIEFTRFRVKRKNIFNRSSYFDRCRYDPIHNKRCPIFRIGDLLELVESDEEERYRMLQHGAVVRIKIDWKCNLDLGEEQCRPAYSFGRLDSRYVDEQFSFGFKFRYASYWKMNNESHRTLMQVFGLRILVIVNGDAGRFDLFVLTLNIGSMIGVFGIATFLCDIFALYFSEQGNIYRNEKFQSVCLGDTSASSRLPSTHRISLAKRQVALKESISSPENETEF